MLRSFCKRAVVYIYITAVQEEGREPSVIDMYSWKGDTDNSNFTFYYDLVFNVMLGLKCLRYRIHRSNSKFYVAMIHEPNLFRNASNKIALKSLDGVNLHLTLVNLYHTAVENYSKYLKDPDADLNPVLLPLKMRKYSVC